MIEGLFHRTTGVSILLGPGLVKTAGAGVGLLIIIVRQDPQRYKDEIRAVYRSSYTSNESSCRVEYKSATFFEVNTYLKYLSVDKSL